MIRQKVIQYIKQHHLFSVKEKVVVALSGGADSVALLHLLIDNGYICEAAHCNFHLRGAESDRDELFVRELCLAKGIKLHVRHFDTRQIASEKHISIEMAARELRYQWFEELRKESLSAVIAVAHHQDDSVETMLLNLLRGSGIQGLRGIRPKNGHIVRPLLCLSRKEITDFLEHIGQPYVTDSTNLQDEYTRNKIRLQLLPLMQEINPSIKDTLLNTAQYLNDTATLYEISIDEGKKRVLTPEGINIDNLLKEPVPQLLLFEILHPMGFNAAQIDDIFKSLQGQSGKRFYSSKWQIVKDRKQLIFSLPEKNISPILEIKKVAIDDSFVIPRNKSVACIDVDKLKAPLSVRRWQTGDWFIPFGMKGRKKVSDYLTDCKFSLFQKKQVWVVCSGNDIVWLIGERTDNRFRIDNQSKTALIISIKE
ncbi:MAG: tRNA lysidine(34) synthetase TilS [Mediterranea massiliensis]|nr:tRNA lysidine(34) synthetase TilS [Mediterranea massiliensis]